MEDQTKALIGSSKTRREIYAKYFRTKWAVVSSVLQLTTAAILCSFLVFLITIKPSRYYFRTILENSCGIPLVTAAPILATVLTLIAAKRNSLAKLYLALVSQLVALGTAITFLYMGGIANMLHMYWTLEEFTRRNCIDSNGTIVKHHEDYYNSYVDDKGYACVDRDEDIGKINLIILLTIILIPIAFVACLFPVLICGKAVVTFWKLRRTFDQMNERTESTKKNENEDACGTGIYAKYYPNRKARVIAWVHLGLVIVMLISQTPFERSTVPWNIMDLLGIICYALTLHWVTVTRLTFLKLNFVVLLNGISAATVLTMIILFADGPRSRNPGFIISLGLLQILLFSAMTVFGFRPLWKLEQTSDNLGETPGRVVVTNDSESQDQD